ncbi:amidohydrolase family protein [Streptomyces sp. NBC_01788]|uniref:amidohydrolase family protein n=1 Tax=Streptomyces sp. NBC_01788 TaxID=2975940 RepID=UPI002DD94CDD|nr:amidohydrolase family protein [Streptomyces sp. NBC_01788]WSB27369.1 amidohydrolase family protein [Streptomyces sp. NBC_01788]
MADLTLTNVRPWGMAAVDIVVSDGKIRDLVPAGAAGEPGERVDGGGLLALPGFINAHAHVDKSWWGRPWVSYGGESTIAGRIAHERAERDALGIPGVDNSLTVLREFLRHGVTAVRSHVDVDLGIGLRGIDAVRGAAEALGGAIEVEIVAFPQDGVIRRPGVLDLLDQAAANGATSVGGLDPAAIDRDPVKQLDGLFEIAERRGVGVDIHLHDGGELGAFQFELIAERTRRAGLRGKVNVSHGFALGELPAGRQADLLDELAEAGVSWSTVAPVGTAPLPWRGMRDRGMPVGLGTDGIRDLWSPVRRRRSAARGPGLRAAPRPADRRGPRLRGGTRHHPRGGLRAPGRPRPRGRRPRGHRAGRRRERAGRPDAVPSARTRDVRRTSGGPQRRVAGLGGPRPSRILRTSVISRTTFHFRPRSCQWSQQAPQTWTGH